MRLISATTTEARRATNTPRLITLLIVVMATLFMVSCGSENTNGRTEGQDIENPCPDAPSELESTLCPDDDLSCNSITEVDPDCEVVTCDCDTDDDDEVLTWSCVDRGCVESEAEDTRDSDEDLIEDSNSLETEELQFPCELPPSQLEGTSCGERNDFCNSNENVHSCCTVVGCRCEYRDRDPDEDLIWQCSQTGCAESTYECGAICDLRPELEGCGGSEDAFDGNHDENYGEDSMRTPNSE